MPNQISVIDSCGFFVTELGRQACDWPGECECHIVLDRGWFVCIGCDTVYGNTREWLTSMMSRAERPKKP